MGDFYKGVYLIKCLMCVCNTPKWVEEEMVLCVVIKCRCVCKMGFKLGPLYVGKLMDG